MEMARPGPPPPPAQRPPLPSPRTARPSPPAYTLTVQRSGPEHGRCATDGDAPQALAVADTAPDTIPGDTNPAFSMAVVPTDAPLPPPPKMDPIPTAPRTTRRVAFATDDMEDANPAPPRLRLQLFDAPLPSSFGTRVRTASPPADALQLAIHCQRRRLEPVSVRPMTTALRPTHTPSTAITQYKRYKYRRGSRPRRESPRNLVSQQRFPRNLSPSGSTITSTTRAPAQRLAP